MSSSGSTTDGSRGVEQNNATAWWRWDDSRLFRGDEYVAVLEPKNDDTTIPEWIVNRLNGFEVSRRTIGASIQLKVADMPQVRELIAEAVGAECRHAGEPWAGHDEVGCSDDCGGCRVRTFALSMLSGEASDD